MQYEVNGRTVIATAVNGKLSLMAHGNDNLEQMPIPDALRSQVNCALRRKDFDHLAALVDEIEATAAKIDREKQLTKQMKWVSIFSGMFMAWAVLMIISIYSS